MTPNPRRMGLCSILRPMRYGFNITVMGQPKMGQSVRRMLLIHLNKSIRATFATPAPQASRGRILGLKNHQQSRGHSGFGMARKILRRIFCKLCSADAVESISYASKMTAKRDL